MKPQPQVQTPIFTITNQTHHPTPSPQSKTLSFVQEPVVHTHVTPHQAQPTTPKTSPVTAKPAEDATPIPQATAQTNPPSTAADKETQAEVQATAPMNHPAR
jgi:hypothetical protein